MKKTFENIAYVGTYTHKQSQGIYSMYMDPEAGRIEVGDLVAKITNPSYIAITKDNKYLYSVIETEEFNGEPGGGVAAFAMDNTTGMITPINTKSSYGKLPCHLLVDSSNKYLYVANYGDGMVSAYELREDGGIGRLIENVNNGRFRTVDDQLPHAHCVLFTPDNRYLCAVDLGVDRVIAYGLNDDGTFKDFDSHTVDVDRGSGPRHMVFHPNSKFAYIINELSSDIVVVSYSHSDARFVPIQKISTLPDDFSGKNYCAAIYVSKDGNYLYASNRGHNSIAIFNIDESTGKLSLVSYTPTFGEFPRDFAIHPTGDFVVVANQNTNNIVLFAVDRKTGKLELMENITGIDSPVCIKFPNV